MKKISKAEILIWALALLPLAGCLVAGPFLPREIPMHWNASGQVDRYGGYGELLLLAASGFGIALSDVAENCPRQQRTLEACKRAVRYAREHPELLEELLRTRKLPLTRLCEGSGAARKALERHRKYITALLLINTNGSEIIRGHICQMLAPQGGERPA